ncbi:SAM-dependent DNA methyltransferase [Microbacterium sp. CJ88]|uniref:SAM-dependent DNA methyltransferase n=1 Tax=Microbacterium sp. CJ88 TaxID=3445672 RepID=UPI003F65A2D1
MTIGTGASPSALKRRQDGRVAHAKKVLDAVAAKPLVKSRQRVQDHAEVLTPAWLVDDMLDLVKDESERIDSRFLEPACGDGNFLVRVLARKLRTVKARYGKSGFETRHQALLAVMSIYGIEIQADNAADCRTNLLDVFRAFLGLDAEDDLVRAATAVLEVNIVHGDALAMRRVNPETGFPGLPIVFPEWGYLGRGKYQRRDFRLDVLASRSTVMTGEYDHVVFQPVRSHPQMTVKELAE